MYSLRKVTQPDHRGAGAWVSDPVAKGQVHLWLMGAGQIRWQVTGKFAILTLLGDTGHSHNYRVRKCIYHLSFPKEDVPGSVAGSGPRWFLWTVSFPNCKPIWTVTGFCYISKGKRYSCLKIQVRKLFQDCSEAEGKASFHRDEGY